jgi:hypothetical protein
MRQANTKEHTMSQQITTAEIVEIVKANRRHRIRDDTLMTRLTGVRHETRGMDAYNCRNDAYRRIDAAIKESPHLRYLFSGNHSCIQYVSAAELSHEAQGQQARAKLQMATHTLLMDYRTGLRDVYSVCGHTYEVLARSTEQVSCYRTTICPEDSDRLHETDTRAPSGYYPTPEQALAWMQLDAEYQDRLAAIAKMSS